MLEASPGVKCDKRGKQEKGKQGRKLKNEMEMTTQSNTKMGNSVKKYEIKENKI